jgi:hypothetical protein
MVVIYCNLNDEAAVATHVGVETVVYIIASTVLVPLQFLSIVSIPCKPLLVFFV